MADPFAQFEIKTLIPLQLANGLDLSFTNASLFMVISVIAATALMKVSFRKAELVPGRLQSLGEYLCEFIQNMLRDSIGPEGRKYFPFIFSLFMMILIGNLLGLIPGAFTFTSHIAVTGAMGLFVIGMVTFLGFAKHGLKFFRLFLPPGVPVVLLPLISVIEVISYLSRPLSLSVRLFANMMAGHAILKIFAIFCVQMGVAFAIFPVLMNTAVIAFELLVAFLQAYVFAILTCIYLRDVVELH